MKFVTEEKEKQRKVMLREIETLKSSSKSEKGMILVYI